MEVLIASADRDKIYGGTSISEGGIQESSAVLLGHYYVQVQTAIKFMGSLVLVRFG